MRGRGNNAQGERRSAEEERPRRRVGAHAFRIIAGDETDDVSDPTTLSLVDDRDGASASPDGQWQALVHALPQLVWASDATGRWTFTSEQWESFTGLPASSRLGEGWRDQVHPDDRPRAALGWLEALRHGGDFRVRLRLARHDGTWRRFDVHGVPARNADGVVEQWFGAATDVEDALRTEEILREGARRLHVVLEHLSEGVIVADLDGTILQWNRAGLLMHGFQADEESPQQFGHLESLFDLFTLEGECVARGDWPLQRLLRGEMVRDWPLRVQRVDRSWERVFSYGGSRVVMPEGTSLVLLTVTDITDRYLALAETERQRRELERSNKELAQFAFVASHDLQEPLRAVASFSELLDRHYGPQVEERGKRYLHHIADGARRMQQMVRDLLDFAQLGKAAIPLSPVALEDVVATALADLAPAIAEAQATVDVGDLPVVWGNTAQLHQLFLNLIGNALKFRREPLPHVVLGATREGGVYRVSVRDNGIGIAPEHRERVFRVFQRLHARDEYPGSGLGLAIARKIVERHGGEIWLESVVGEGTVFHCSLLSADRPLPDDMTLLRASAVSAL